ncbi:MAG TPA: 16S rRNA (cytidine(1402)-2'-O)-methyltransferase [Candidatus Cloacimonadota bacterium]|nr:16S rRNA (cytidine(1402)-2'-O)-methyltransferase [Candidatus Cloacimonadota bacterium]HQL14191.1 16S rRNA (cytidine(1402)-2'-O)-methyltransferase [Candidatus Cloacimonadota bacterium]
MIQGTLYLVPTPIGNLGDMTFRGVETLKTVDLIACEDTRTSQVLLNHYGIKNKLISYHKFNEAKQTNYLLERLKEGKNIAVITDAGTPGISDPASVLVKAAIAEKIKVTCLPGATALIPALSASGLETGIFTFVGFLPSQKKERKALLKEIQNLSHTLVIYEASHRIKETLSELSEYFSDRQCVIAREISKLYETFYRGKLEDFITSEEIEARGEFVILLSGKLQTALNEEELIPLIKQEIDKGKSLKEIANELSKATGCNRNKIYTLALKIKQQ